MAINLTPKRALILFLTIVVFLAAQAVWWIMFIARLTDEKVDMARELGASAEFVQHVEAEEFARQIMVGLEGTTFLLIYLVGVWLIYRSLVRAEELKFHQQNFLMAVTHELKTPLASLKLYIDALKSPKISDEKKATVFPRMTGDLLRLEKLVENVLDAGRFERSGYKLRPEEFNLTAMIEKSLDLINNVPHKFPLELETDLKPDMIFYGDRVAFGQAIDSILENSMKYHDQDSIKLSVKLTERKSLPVIEITDNGIGLAKKDTQNIFERFYRVGDEMTRSASGTGLGLFLCREIVKAHKGEVIATSEGLGKGSTFIITFKRRLNGEKNSSGRG